MKSILFIIILLVSFSSNAQIVEGSLMKIHNHPKSDITTIATPTTVVSKGEIIYDTNREEVFIWDGTKWKQFFAGPIVRVVSASQTITDDFNGKVINVNATASITLTLAAGLPLGFNVSIYQTGAGVVTIAGAAGVTVKNRFNRFKTAGVDAAMGVIATSANVFHITGDLQ